MPLSPCRYCHLNEKTPAGEESATAKALYYAPFYPFGESNNVDASVECLLLKHGGRRRHVDPDRLPYRERILWRLKKFCLSTSSHGIPWLGRSPNAIYRCIWTFLLLVSLTMFLSQVWGVVLRYKRHDKITDIQLNLDTAPFPAITVCSLNPYLEPLLKDVDAIKKILNVYSNVMLKATRQHEKQIGDIVRQSATQQHSRRRRQAVPAISNLTFFEPAYASCVCEEGEDTECTAEQETLPPEYDASAELDSPMRTCMCAFDRDSGDAWPCYPREKWSETRCGYCDWKQYCTADEKEGEARADRPCYCQTVDPFCVAYNETAGILQLWEYHGNYGKKVLETLGFQNMSDEVAIMTKAKENIIFAMSELSESQRIALSVKKNRLIVKCSFDGVTCDIDNDFAIIADPTFGNCYTFNHRRNETKWSSRAGAQHGLRMMVLVNTSEYLPMTEGVGVRITIHDKDEFPFPDTFGFYAPTGAVSSFGMRLSRMSRLSAPFGDCHSPFDTDGGRYVYSGYRYSTEGCYRSCFQQFVVKNCGCGDPRFPVLGAHHCEAFDPEARKCLEEQTTKLGGGKDGERLRCECPHPCEQSVYSVSYSAANWPIRSQLSSGRENEDWGVDFKDVEYLRENGAMIEVFYEALNFETLKESEAYGFVKMMADFGGQLGLWSGVSFMTCCEFIFLVLDLIYIVAQHYWAEHQAKQKKKQGASL